MSKIKKYSISALLALALKIFLASSINAQSVTYLSGEDAATAIDWDFKISTGRNHGYWSTIPVPSNWETQGFGQYTYGNDPEDYETNPEIGFYRHTFYFDRKKDKRQFLVFQGSMTETTVWLNGQQIGEVHIGGFTEFKYEITELINNGENILEVTVRKSSTNEQVQKAERISDFWLFGGIFRPVYIEEVPTNFIDRVAIDAQMDGSFTMDVFTGGKEDAFVLTARIYDSDHQQVGEPFSAKSEKNVGRLTANFTDVKLWSHELPALYTVEVQLKSGEEILHTYSEKFGFRTFEVRDHDGFYLNGKRILLKGANMHSFRPATGRALSRKDMLENVRIMQEMNFNTVRICHYPPDAGFLDLCDSLGLLAMDELPGWRHALPNDIGSKLVKELVVRDVNHPSVVLWSNGNHLAHNPYFDEVFFKWDIQKRRPLKNETKTGDIYKGYAPDFDIVKTNFYPPFNLLKQRLFEEDHIVLPNEALHALYDGGGGANLKTYWDALEASKVGGGLMIWALFDEGVFRTDLNNQPDNKGNRGADGILGPSGEKEGSFYAVREIWSPVIISEDEITSSFDGKITVENKFSFLNLNQCSLSWKLIAYEKPNTSSSGFRTVGKGKIKAPDVKPGSLGVIEIIMPEHLPDFDALAIEVLDNKGALVYEKRLLLDKETSYFQSSKTNKFIQDEKNPFLFYFGSTTLEFNQFGGVLKTIAVEGKPTSINNFPFIDVAAEDSTLVNKFSPPSQASVKRTNDGFVIEAKQTNGFDYLRWNLSSSGEIKLDYKFTLEKGLYNYTGIGLNLNADEVKSKRWLGEGPARIWKNRTEGGILDVFAVDKKSNVPGQVYNQPEFEGYFAPWKWAIFYMENNLSIGFKNNTNLVLGVLNPINGETPQFATWKYPEKEGLYFFNTISAVGSKWKDPKEFGPDAQPALIEGVLMGSVSLYINWNHPDRGTKLFNIDIE